MATAPSSSTEPAPEQSQPQPGAHRRHDIQGLRAIAVIMVVAFHAGLPVPGGFVGVDVFFVISGFVITAMLHREFSTTGRIRFGRFYLRRFTRLTPALALTVAFTVVVSAIVLSPFIDQPTAALTGVGAMLLSANVAIASATGGYFDAPAEVNPLLNMWSLSVEEQFYLIFPAILVIGWLIARRGLVLRAMPYALVGGVAVISFVFAVRGSGEPALPGLDGFLFGFYSPLTRAWEFAVGALLALALSHSIRFPPRWFLSVFAVSGAGLLIASLWLITDATPFPGPLTLLPVTGTLILIYVGAASTKNVVSSALGTEPMVKVGDWSYSIYLWHWPVIVFAVYLWPFTPQIALIAAVISLAPALASYYFIEQRIRVFTPGSRTSLWRLVGAVMIPPLLLAGGLGALAKFYWQPQFVAGEVEAVHVGDTDWPDFYAYLSNTYYPCADDAIRESADSYEGFVRCSQSQPGSDVDIAIVGDSHAEQYFVGLAEAFPQKNIAFYILAGTAPIEDNARMSVIIDHVAQSPTITTVLLSARWSLYDLTKGSLAKTLVEFTENGKRVFVTDDIPHYPFPAHRCQYGMSPLLPIVQCSSPREAYDSEYSQYITTLTSEVAQVPGSTLVTTNDYLCSDETCDMTIGNEILYRDNDHLNNIGSRYFVKKLLQDYPELQRSLVSSS